MIKLRCFSHSVFDQPFFIVFFVSKTIIKATAYFILPILNLKRTNTSNAKNDRVRSYYEILRSLRGHILNNIEDIEQYCSTD